MKTIWLARQPMNGKYVLFRDNPEKWSVPLYTRDTFCWVTDEEPLDDFCPGEFHRLTDIRLRKGQKVEIELPIRFTRKGKS